LIHGGGAAAERQRPLCRARRHDETSSTRIAGTLPGYATDMPESVERDPDQHRRADVATARNETEAERLDRNYNELLQELRVSQTGVQILFAFLLTLAFSQRFHETTSFQRGTYVVTLLLAAGATALIIAPVPFHRLVFRRQQKANLVRVANRLAIGGLVLMFLAMVGAVLLILDVVLRPIPAVLLSGLVAVWCLLFWFVLPIAARLREDRALGMAAPHRDEDRTVSR
jgi:Family of unknown function (DUF6328)